jgi:5'-nucleotidase
MRVLVTNDDGVESPGLHELAQCLAACGDHDLVIAAPDRDMSGSSAAIGQIHVDEHIDAEHVDLPGLAGVPTYAVAGPPGLCVLAARLGGFGPPPDLIVSGINPGANTGRAVLHSGTVGAALTAASFGCRGLAVSLDVSAKHLYDRVRHPARAAAVPSVDGSSGADSVVPDSGLSAQVVSDGDGVVDASVPGIDDYDDPARWGTAAMVATTMMRWLADAPAGVVLNVNVPNLPFDQLVGTQTATLAPFGRVRSSVVESAEAGGRLQMELRPTEEELPLDCDTALVDQGFVAVSALAGIRIDTAVDLSGLLDHVLVDGRRTA